MCKFLKPFKFLFKNVIYEGTSDTFLDEELQKIKHLNEELQQTVKKLEYNLYIKRLK